MESQYVRLKSGLKIHYLAAGDLTAPRVVLVHGWPTNALLWRKIIPGLAGRFRVLAPDLPGHGLSAKPADAPYNLDFFHQFLREFFQAMGLDRAHLVAHDLGGIAGLGLAVRNPGLIKKFVVMNTGPYKELPPLVSFFLAALRQPFLTGFFLRPPIFRLLMKQGIHHRERVTASLASLYLRPFAKTPGGRKAFSNTIAIPPENMVESPEKLRQITMPTLILWGTKDGFFKFAVARRLHKDIRGSWLTAVPHAGHFLQEDQPEQVLAALNRFLRSRRE